MNEYLDENKQEKLSRRVEQNLLNVENIRQARALNKSFSS
jgi:hypothetical protein